MSADSLQASLVQSRWTSGKVHGEHIGALGSVDAEVSVHERVAFWPRYTTAWPRLATEAWAKLKAAIWLMVC